MNLAIYQIFHNILSFYTYVYKWLKNENFDKLRIAIRVILNNNTKKMCILCNTDEFNLDEYNDQSEIILSNYDYPGVVKIMNIHNSLCDYTSMEIDCPQLLKLPKFINIENSIHLEMKNLEIDDLDDELINSININTDIREIIFSHCNNLKIIKNLNINNFNLSIIFSKCKNLEKIINFDGCCDSFIIKDCNNLIEIPDRFLQQIYDFHIINCDNIRKIGDIQSYGIIVISNCKNLEIINSLYAINEKGKEFYNNITIINCEKLEKIENLEYSKFIDRKSVV
jgi:hypothetical protein